MDAGASERVVLVHDWLTGMRGGEKCLEPLCRRWPDARLLTLLHKRGSVSPDIERVRIRPSSLNRLPRVERYYRYLLPLMPFAAGWRVTDADLVVSFSHCVAKSAVPPPGVPHVCYCFTPMRYAWHMKDAYFRPTGLLGRLKAAGDRSCSCRASATGTGERPTASRTSSPSATRSATASANATAATASSSTRRSTPTSTRPPDEPREDFYLVVSALAPYKRFDLAIEACRKLGRKLVVIGSGQERGEAARRRPGRTSTFLGWQSDEVIRDHLRRAKALLFPGEEDFGIVPLEAQACGCPVIGFGRGGLTETVRPLGRSTDPTGVFFDEQTPDAVAEAIERVRARRRPLRPEGRCGGRRCCSARSGSRASCSAILDAVVAGAEQQKCARLRKMQSRRWAKRGQRARS